MNRSLLATLAVMVLMAVPGLADQCQRQRIVVRQSYGHSSYQTAYYVQPLYQVGSALREDPPDVGNAFAHDDHGLLAGHIPVVEDLRLSKAG